MTIVCFTARGGHSLRNYPDIVDWN